MEYNKSNKKYFLFSTDISEDTEADAVIYPCERLKGISPASDTTCIMYFEPLKITDVATSDVVDKVTLTYTSGSFREVIKTILDAVNSSATLITIADSDNPTRIGSSIGEGYTGSSLNTYNSIFAKSHGKIKLITDVTITLAA